MKCLSKFFIDIPISVHTSNNSIVSWLTHVSKWTSYCCCSFIPFLQAALLLFASFRAHLVCVLNGFGLLFTCYLLCETQCATKCNTGGSICTEKWRNFFGLTQQITQNHLEKEKISFRDLFRQKICYLITADWQITEIIFTIAAVDLPMRHKITLRKLTIIKINAMEPQIVRDLFSSFN